VVDLEYAVEQGDLEDLADVRVVTRDHEFAAGRTQTLDRAHQHTQRRRVDEGRVRQVNEDAARAARHDLAQGLLQLGRGGEVDLAGDADAEDPVAEIRGCKP